MCLENLLVSIVDLETKTSSVFVLVRPPDFVTAASGWLRLCLYFPASFEIMGAVCFEAECLKGGLLLVAEGKQPRPEEEAMDDGLDFSRLLASLKSLQNSLYEILPSPSEALSFNLKRNCFY